MQTTLATLRDIEGVLGSFLVDEYGQLVARDMPGVFDDATLSSASLRLARLRGALENDAPSFTGCVARFGDHLLVVRPVAERLLCVLVPKGTNLNALQMGTNLVSRRLANTNAASVDIPPYQPPQVAQSAAPRAPVSGPSLAPSAPLPTPVGSMGPPGNDTLSGRVPAPMEPILSAPPSAPPMPPNATIALLTRPRAPSESPPPGPRESTPPVDPHPTRPLPKRFFRGRPVP